MHLGKRIVSLIILGVCFCQILLYSVEYLQFDYNFTNPIIPQSLIQNKLNFTVFMIMMYLVVIISNLLYQIKQKFFWSIIVFSFIGLILLNLFKVNISGYFMNS